MAADLKANGWQALEWLSGHIATVITKCIKQILLNLFQKVPISLNINFSSALS